MEKMEYLARMFNRRTKNKNYENFVVNAIYSRIANLELIPATQQFVRNKNKAIDERDYYFLDLYFPQLNYGIEVDECHHIEFENIISDKQRTLAISSAIACEEGRISIFNEKKELRSYEDISTQIDEQVKIVKNRILEKEKKDGQKLKWLGDDEIKKLIEAKRCFDINDKVDYNGITEILSIIKGADAKNPQTGFKKLNDNYKLWVPYLAINLDDGTIKTRNGWKNFLDEEKNEITEIVNPEKFEKCDTKNIPDGDWNENGFKRIVFMHVRDLFGKDSVKFLGVFQAYKIEMFNNTQRRYYKRIATEINFNELQDK